jgi:hypothetical protein
MRDFSCWGKKKNIITLKGNNNNNIYRERVKRVR